MRQEAVQQALAAMHDKPKQVVPLPSKRASVARPVSNVVSGDDEHEDDDESDIDDDHDDDDHDLCETRNLALGLSDTSSAGSLASGQHRPQHETPESRGHRSTHETPETRGHRSEPPPPPLPPSIQSRPLPPSPINKPLPPSPDQSPAHAPAATYREMDIRDRTRAERDQRHRHRDSRDSERMSGASNNRDAERARDNDDVTPRDNRESERVTPRDNRENYRSNKDKNLMINLSCCLPG